MVCDALVLRVKHCFFQHAQDDHSADPKLDPEQVAPITGQPEEPRSSKQHIHDAHNHEELLEHREHKFTSSYLTSQTSVTFIAVIP